MQIIGRRATKSQGCRVVREKHQERKIATAPRRGHTRSRPAGTKPTFPLGATTKESAGDIHEELFIVQNKYFTSPTLGGVLLKPGRGVPSDNAFNINSAWEYTHFAPLARRQVSVRAWNKWWWWSWWGGGADSLGPNAQLVSTWVIDRKGEVRLAVRRASDVLVWPFKGDSSGGRKLTSTPQPPPSPPLTTSTGNKNSLRCTVTFYPRSTSRPSS